jgi:hypothetical protein
MTKLGVCGVAMASPTVTNFMKQQGFPEEPPDACNMHFAGLYFQPRIVFPLILVGITLGWLGLHLVASLIFLVLAAVLSWNAMLPRSNPFELAYNRFVAPRRGLPLLAPAPGPRRFAQGMAATLLLGAAIAQLVGATLVAAVLEALLAVAFVALLFGRFCLGAYIYHLLRGRVAFANATLPWARG